MAEENVSLVQDIYECSMIVENLAVGVTDELRWRLECIKDWP